MKFLGLILLFICGLSVAVLGQDQGKRDPQVNGNVGGSPKDGYNVNVDVRKNIWESNNGKHSVDATGGYSQHLGGPYGNSRPDYRGGATYTYRW